MTTRWTMAILIVLMSAVLFACGNYYMVKDPTTGKTYYTTEVKNEGSAVVFTDAKSENKVTLQNSEVKEIDSDQFDAGLKATEESKLAEEKKE